MLWTGKKHSAPLDNGGQPKVTLLYLLSQGDRPSVSVAHILNVINACETGNDTHLQ